MNLCLAALVLTLSRAGQDAGGTTSLPEIPPNYALALVEMPEVAADLRLTREQRAAVRAVRSGIEDEFGPRMRAAQRLEELEPSQGLEAFRAFERVATEYRRAGDTRTVAVLNAPQRDRLRAIQYQSIGFRALLLKDLRDGLGLRSEQVAEIGRLCAEIAGRRSGRAKVDMMVRLRGKPGTLDGEETRFKADLAQIDAEFEARAASVLTREQAALYVRRLGVRLPSVAGTAPWISGISWD